MEGKTHSVGALTGLKTGKRPIRLARTIMTGSKHVMVAQEGAEPFAKVSVDNYSFIVSSGRSPTFDCSSGDKFGTVGAVALDQDGSLAAGTSTGEISNKRFVRAGDSPIGRVGTRAMILSRSRPRQRVRTTSGAWLPRGRPASPIRRHASAGHCQNSRWGSTEALGGVGGVNVLDPNGNIASPRYDRGGVSGRCDADGPNQVQFFGSKDGSQYSATAHTVQSVGLPPDRSFT